MSHLCSTSGLLVALVLTVISITNGVPAQGGKFTAPPGAIRVALDKKNSVVFGKYELAFLGSDNLIAYQPATGVYRIHGFSRSGKPGCPSLSDFKHAGMLGFSNHKLVNMEGNTILDVDPQTGAFRVLKCDPKLFARGLQVACATVVEGMLPGFVGNDVVYIGASKILVLNSERGELETYNFNRSVVDIASLPRDEANNVVPFKGPHPLVGQALFESVAGREITYLGNNMVFDYSLVTGKYRVWLLDMKGNFTKDLFFGPIQEGIMPDTAHFFLNVGFGSIIDYDPASGKYLIMNCDNRKWKTNAPLPCSMGAEGFIFKDAGCSIITDPKTCLLNADPKCGYCASVKRCMEGTAEGSCDSPCSESDWLFGASGLKELSAVTPDEIQPPPGPPLQPDDELETPLPPNRNTTAHQLTYMGDNLLLDFDPMSGRYYIWRHDRDASGTDCNAFPSPPYAEGMMMGATPGKFAIKKLQLVYLGNDRIMYYLGQSGLYTIYNCEKAELSEGLQSACAVQASGKWGNIVGQQVWTYMGKDRLFDFEPLTGRLRVWHVRAGAVGADNPLSSRTVQEGMLPEWRNHILEYIGEDLVMVYQPNSADFTVWKYIRNGVYSAGMEGHGIFHGPISVGRLPGNGQRYAVGLMEGRVTVYDSDGAFSLMDCAFNVERQLFCSLSAQGSMAEGLPCQHNTRLACLADVSCGWCMGSQVCLRGKVAGPAKSTCPSGWEFGGVQPLPPIDLPSAEADVKARVMHQILYLGGDVLFDYSPTTGAYKLWNFDRKRAGMCDSFPAPAFSTGLWPTVGHKFVYLGFDYVLDYNPAKGTYKVIHCGANAYRKGQPMKCEVQTEGTWASFKPDQLLVYLGGQRLLDYERLSGNYRVWHFDRSASGETDPLPLPVVTEGQLDDLKERNLAYLGNDLVMSYDLATGNYSFLFYDRNVTTPSGSGALMPVDEAEKDSFGMQDFRVIPLMDGEVMVVDPVSGKYSLQVCQGPSLENREIEPDCDIKTEGNLFTGHPCQYANKTDCICDSKCGWCDTTATCHEGNRYESCNQMECPSWVFTCPKDLLLNKLKDAQPTAPALTMPDKLMRARKVCNPTRTKHDVTFLAGNLGTGFILDWTPEQKLNVFYLVENDLSLDMSNPDSDPSHCYAMEFPPKATMTWQYMRTPLDGQYIVEQHRFLALQRDWLMDWDPKFGTYQILQCNPAKLLNGINKACEITVAGMFDNFECEEDIIYIGKGRLLRFNPTNGRYTIQQMDFRVRGTADPLKTKIVSGVWEELIGSQLVYLNSSMIMDIKQSTLRYRIWLYDRSITGKGGGMINSTYTPGTVEAAKNKVFNPLFGPISSGTVPHDDMQWLHLDSERMLGYNTWTGRYRVYFNDQRLYHESTPLPFYWVGQGSLEQRPCNYTECGECTSDPHCGWCANTQTCFEGTVDGACVNMNCQNTEWEYDLCGDEPCGFFHTCEDCQRLEHCGWCGGNQQCLQTDPSDTTRPTDTHPMCPFNYKYHDCNAADVRLMSATNIKKRDAPDEDAEEKAGKDVEEVAESGKDPAPKDPPPTSGGPKAKEPKATIEE